MAVSTKTCVSVVLLGLCLTGMAVAAAKGEDWSRFESREKLVSSGPPEMALPARSAIDCGRTCHRFAFCASFSFSPLSSSCSLHPQTSESGPDSDSDSGSNKDRVFVLAAADPPPCAASDLPSPPRTSLVLRRSLTSLEADVMCHAGYILGHGLTGSDGANHTRVTTSCPADRGRHSRWSPAPPKNLVCKRRVWRLPGVKLYPLPRTLEKGWSLCVSGTVSRDSGSVSLALYKRHSDDGDGIVPLLLQLFPGNASVCLQSKARDRKPFSPCETHPLPAALAVGQALSLRLHMVGHSDLDVYVDGAVLARFTSPLPLAETVGVYLGNQTTVQWTRLDAWC